MKKAITLLLTISLGTSLGCGSGDLNSPATEGPEQSAVSEQDTVPELLEGAPRLTIPHIVTSETSAVVPITVEQFDGIGCYELKILYDPQIITATAVEVAPGVGAYFYGANYLTPGEIKIYWLWFQPYVFEGQILEDGSVFLNITFTKAMEGVSDITWDYSRENNIVVADGGFDPMNDKPYENFYIDGSLEFK